MTEFSKHIKPDSLLVSLYELFNFFSSTIRSRYYFYLCFPDGDTEAWRSEIACQHYAYGKC